MKTLPSYPNLPTLHHTDSGNFFLIAGPCVIEDDKSPFQIAERLLEITDKLHMKYGLQSKHSQLRVSIMGRKIISV